MSNDQEMCDVATNEEESDRGSEAAVESNTSKITLDNTLTSASAIDGDATLTNDDQSSPKKIRDAKHKLSSSSERLVSSSKRSKIQDSRLSVDFRVSINKPPGDSDDIDDDSDEEE